LPPRRRASLSAETAARRDLKALPKDISGGGLGIAYLVLARRMDAGVSTRDAATLAREMRMVLLAMHEMAPPAAEDDFVDELRLKREQRMLEAQ
jgi:hypothetical protein